MRKLPFQVRGAVYEAAASLALRAGLTEEAADGLLGVMLGFIGGDQVRVHGVLGPATTPEVGAAPALTGGWPAAGAPIERLTQAHGTVLLAGEKKPTTYRVGYRDLEGVVRLAEAGDRADWATRWWELP